MDLILEKWRTWKILNCSSSQGRICADRIDYALREIYYEHSKETAKECFDNLIVHDGAIVFSSKKQLQSLRIYSQSAIVNTGEDREVQ